MSSRDSQRAVLCPSSCRNNGVECRAYRLRITHRGVSGGDSEMSGDGFHRIVVGEFRSEVGEEGRSLG